MLRGKDAEGARDALPLAKDGEEVELRDGLPVPLVDTPEEGLLDIEGDMVGDLEGCNPRMTPTASMAKILR